MAKLKKQFKKILILSVLFSLSFNYTVNNAKAEETFEIKNNTIYFENELAKVEIYPATSMNIINQHQQINITWKGDAKKIDIAFGFDVQLPTKDIKTKIGDKFISSKNTDNEKYKEKDMLVEKNYNVNKNNYYEFVIDYNTHVKSNGKWDLYIKDSKDTWDEAMLSDNIVHIDPWWNANWNYKRQIVIDKTYIDQPLKNFPVYIKINSSVIDKADGGNSIRFVDSTETTEYNYEIETWNVGGYSHIWVNITSISNLTNTVFYMYYNNSAVGDNQHPMLTWNSDYIMVHHFNDVGDSQSNDSTVNDMDLSLYNSYLKNGNANSKIGYGIELDGANYYIRNGSIPGYNVYTVEGWFKVDTSKVQYAYANGGPATAFYADGSTWTRGGITTSAGTIATGTWYYLTEMGNGSNADFFIDCVNKGTAASTSDLTGSLSIGCDSSGNYKLDGVIDEWRISQVYRNTSWLKATYQTINNPTSFMNIGLEESFNISAPTYLNASTTFDKDINISWTKGVNTSYTYIERNTNNFWNIGEGTQIYNDTGNYYIDTGLSDATKYYYQAWGYNTTVHCFSGSNYTNNITSPGNPSGIVCNYDVVTTSNNISWAKGDYADKTVIIEKSGSFPATSADGTEIYNGTGVYFNDTTATENSFYRLYSFNDTVDQFSTGINAHWGSLVIRVYDENTSASLDDWDVIISNSDKSDVYVNLSANNPLSINIDDLPYGNNTLIRINKTWYNFCLFYMDLESGSHYTLNAYLSQKNDTQSYILRVINQNDYPISGAKVYVKRYINESTGYGNTSIPLTDGNGYCTVNLIPNIDYAVSVVADGYINETFDLQPIPITYVEDRYHTYKLTAESIDIIDATTYRDVITFEGYASGDFIYVNFSDTSGLTSNVNIIVYEIDNTTGNITAYGWYNTTSTSFSTSFSRNSSNTYHVVMFLNHSSYKRVFDTGFYLGSTKTYPTSRNEFDDIFTNVFGTNAFTWSGFFGLFVLMICLFSFGEYHTGLGLILTGFCMLGFNYVLGLLLLNATFCILIVVLGIFVQWRMERRRIDY